MAEWFVEHGIGEDRAVLIEDGNLRAARLSWPGGLAAGLVAEARLVARTAGRKRGTVRFDDGEEALVDGLAPNASEGAMIRVEIVRAAMAEKGRYKRAQARPTTRAVQPAPDLTASLRASGLPVRTVQRFPDDPWPEVLAEAVDGVIAFRGGSLTISPTPAMTLIDIDGTLPPAQLGLTAVPAIAAAIGRLDLSGSIGIDFPTFERREDRRALDEALSTQLAHWPHQRTAMNGFGFVQLVARLERPSILARVQRDPARAGALLLLRRAEDVTGPGSLLMTANPRVIAAVRPEWHEALQRRSGRQITWHADPTLALLGGFAQSLSS